MSSVEIGKYIAESPVDDTENTPVNSIMLSGKPTSLKSFLETLILAYLKLDYVCQVEVEKPIALMKRIKKKKCRTETARRGSRKLK